jgi:hypothetical protein
VPTLLDAFINGQKANEGAAPVGGPAQPSSPFQAGAEWVRQVLEPAINQGNADLGPAQVSFQLDVNLDPQSTNHAHADFWLTQNREGQRAVGPKYSINVRGHKVWLYKTNAPGRDLGNIDQCGPDRIQTLLKDAAEEFGEMTAKLAPR